MSQFNLLDLGDKSGAGVGKFMHSVVHFHPTCKPIVNMDFPLITRNGPSGTILCHCIFCISDVPIFLHLLLSFHLITCTANEIIIYTHDLLSLQSYWISMLFYSCSAILNQSLGHLTSRSGRQPGIFTSRLTPSHIS